MLFERYPDAFNAPNVLIEVFIRLVNSFFSIRFVIVKDHFTQSFQPSIKCFAFVRSCELFNERLQIRILRNHKRCNWNVHLSRLRLRSNPSSPAYKGDGM